MIVTNAPADNIHTLLTSKGTLWWQAFSLGKALVTNRHIVWIPTRSVMISIQTALALHGVAFRMPIATSLTTLVSLQSPLLMIAILNTNEASWSGRKPVYLCTSWNMETRSVVEHQGLITPGYRPVTIHSMAGLIQTPDNIWSNSTCFNLEHISECQDTTFTHLIPGCWLENMLPCQSATQHPYPVTSNVVQSIGAIEYHGTEFGQYLWVNIIN